MNSEIAMQPHVARLLNRVPGTRYQRYIFTPRQYEFVVSYYTRMLHEYRYDTQLCQNSIVPVGMNRYPEVGVQGYYSVATQQAVRSS